MNESKKSPTGRLHPSEPALQNVPVRTELGAEIRRAFSDSPDQLVSVNYKEIELRALARYLQELNSQGDL